MVTSSNFPWLAGCFCALFCYSDNFSASTLYVFDCFPPILRFASFFVSFSVFLHCFPLDFCTLIILLPFVVILHGYMGVTLWYFNYILVMRTPAGCYFTVSSFIVHKICMQILCAHQLAGVHYERRDCKITASWQR